MPQRQQDKGGQRQAAKQAELDGELQVVVVRVVEVQANVFAGVLREDGLEAPSALAYQWPRLQQWDGIAEHVVAHFVGLLHHFAIDHYIVQLGAE